MNNHSWVRLGEVARAAQKLMDTPVMDAAEAMPGLLAAMAAQEVDTYSDVWACIARITTKR